MFANILGEQIIGCFYSKMSDGQDKDSLVLVMASGTSIVVSDPLDEAAPGYHVLTVAETGKIVAKMHQKMRTLAGVPPIPGAESSARSMVIG
jgi:hypothetical protein